MEVASIPVELSVEEFLRNPSFRRLKEEDVAHLIEKCRPLIEPKTVYMFSKVTGIEQDKVTLGGIHTFRSKILADMLVCGQTVAPHVVTIGPRLEQQIAENAEGSVLQNWVTEKIGDYALGKASARVRELLAKTLGEDVSSFSPGTGTGELFSIEQQEVLFRLLDPPTNVGVHLTPSYLMVPRKSVSGILAATSEGYVACQYCPREKCENRKRPFSGEYRNIKCNSQHPSCNM